MLIARSDAGAVAGADGHADDDTDRGTNEGTDASAHAHHGATDAGAVLVSNAAADTGAADTRTDTGLCSRPISRERLRGRTGEG